MSEHNLKFGSATITYELTYKQRKTMGIKVLPDCSVKVVAPVEAPLEQIKKKLKEKAPWILKQQKEFLSYHPLTPARLYVNGETHLYLGRQYKLKIEPAEFNEVKLIKGRLIVFCNSNTKPSKILGDWYKEKASAHFHEIAEDILPLFSRYNIEKPDLQIRTMAKRWGSCTPSGKIILNPELIKAPKGSIEYVIIHELCHLIHHNHTKAFYNLQQRMMPDWKKWKERLEYSLV